MNFKRIKKRYIILSAVNMLSLAGFLVLSLIGGSQAGKQAYNYACERWGGEDSDDYAQISCFMSESSGFTTDSINMVRGSVLSSLQEISVVPEEGQKLCPDAYSAPVGKATVISDIKGRSEAEITAVGGDFFNIHNFRLIDGSYFNDDDIMQDGAVIDRTLAWSLYGSYEISGMNITINGTQFYISGVIETPQTDEEQKCAGELPRAYISYDGASGFAGSGGFGTDDLKDEDVTSSGKFNTISCYEIIMPDPVEGYALKSVKTAMEGYGNEAAVIQNNDRFDAFKRLKALKNLSLLAVKDNQIIYPYWENAARITEFKLSFIYLAAIVFLIIPAATLLWLIIKGIKTLKRNKEKYISFFKNKIKKKKHI